MSKMWYIYYSYSVYTIVQLFHICMEYYSATKKNEVLVHATTWIKPKDLMLSEIKQTETTNYMTPLN